MKINLRIDRQTSAHCYLTLFINHAKAGEPTLRHQEARDLRDVFRIGGGTAGDGVEFSGDWSGL